MVKIRPLVQKLWPKSLLKQEPWNRNRTRVIGLFRTEEPGNKKSGYLRSLCWIYQIGRKIRSHFQLKFGGKFKVLGKFFCQWGKFSKNWEKNCIAHRQLYILHYSTLWHIRTRKIQFDFNFYKFSLKNIVANDFQLCIITAPTMTKKKISKFWIFTMGNEGRKLKKGLKKWRLFFSDIRSAAFLCTWRQQNCMKLFEVVCPT